MNAPGEFFRKMALNVCLSLNAPVRLFGKWHLTKFVFGDTVRSFGPKTKGTHPRCVRFWGCVLSENSGMDLSENFKIVQITSEKCQNILN